MIQYKKTSLISSKYVEKDDLKDEVEKLKNETYSMLLDLCAVDYPDSEFRFEIVYHFLSVKRNNRVRIKVKLREGESLESITEIQPSADWFEREAFDLFGVEFKGHPNLKRILTHHEFQGHPLRKDYPADYQQHLSAPAPVQFSKGECDENLMPLNIGPSHPAVHGALRIVADLEGETIKKADVEIGYLHRCFEKMSENHAYNQVIPFTDRLNYCSAPINNVAYCKAVEELMDIEIPEKAQALRIVLCELSRTIDHIVCIGAGAVDVGAVTSFFQLFSYRELVYSLFEKLCGARLTVSLTRIGGMAQEPPAGWYKEVLKVCDQIAEGVKDLDDLLTVNKIFIKRTSGVGVVSAKEAISYGYTGPLLRASGVQYDLRVTEPYYIYDQLDFDMAVGTTGDLYDRYLVRVEEMRQSLKIIKQICENVPEGDYTIRDRSIVLPEKKDVYGNIEGLMSHFMLIINGLKPPKGEIYSAVESANGELGFYLVSDGSGKPYRLKVRPPCFQALQSFPEQIEGLQTSDAIAVLGSMNIVAGELDR